jgi:hypothetical protein
VQAVVVAVVAVAAVAAKEALVVLAEVVLIIRCTELMLFQQLQIPEAVVAAAIILLAETVVQEL